MILAMLDEAWNSIISNKLRSTLTIIGIAIGVCAVVLMVAVGQTVQLEIDKQLEGIGGNMMIILPASVNRGGINSARGTTPTLTFDDARAIKKIKNVVNVAPTLRNNFQVIVGANNWNTAVFGTNTEFLDISEYEIEKGNMFSERDVYSGSPYAVVGKTVVDKLFPSGENPIGKNIRIKTTPFKIVAVLKEKGASARGDDQDDIIIVPVKAFKTRLTRNKFPNMVGVILLTFDDPKNMKMVERRIQNLLETRHKTIVSANADFEVINLTEIVKKITMIGLVLTILLASAAGISLFVGSIGIMNMMLTSVTERTKEIGVRKAIGAPDSSILCQFLFESVLISSIGSFIGMMLGVVIALTAGHILERTVPISITVVIISILASFVVGIASGIVPAIKATKLNPIDALKF